MVVPCDGDGDGGGSMQKHKRKMKDGRQYVSMATEPPESQQYSQTNRECRHNFVCHLPVNNPMKE